MFTSLYIYIYIYIYIEREREIDIMYNYIYAYVCICIYIYIYMHNNDAMETSAANDTATWCQHNVRWAARRSTRDVGCARGKV